MCRVAWRYWLDQKDLEQLGKFVDSLWLLYDMRGWYHATVDLTTDLLGVLSTTPSTPELMQQEIVLRTSLARALLATKGYTPEVEEAYLRAGALSGGGGYLPDVPGSAVALLVLFLAGRIRKGVPIGTQILDLAELTTWKYAGRRASYSGNRALFTGNIDHGLEHLEKGISLIDPHRHRSSRFRIGNYPGVSNYTALSMILWMMGYPDRALNHANQAVELAKEVNHPYSLAYALFHAGFIYHWRREVELSLEYAQEVLELAERQKFQIWHAVGTCLHGAGLQAWEGSRKVWPKSNWGGALPGS